LISVDPESLMRLLIEQLACVSDSGRQRWAREEGSGQRGEMTGSPLLAPSTALRSGKPASARRRRTHGRSGRAQSAGAGAGGFRRRSRRSKYASAGPWASSAPSVCFDTALAGWAVSCAVTARNRWNWAGPTNLKHGVWRRRGPGEGRWTTARRRGGTTGPDDGGRDDGDRDKRRKKKTE
jgi:hypothetical protein